MPIMFTSWAAVLQHVLAAELAVDEVDVGQLCQSVPFPVSAEAVAALLQQVKEAADLCKVTRSMYVDWLELRLLAARSCTAEECASVLAGYAVPLTERMAEMLERAGMLLLDGRRAVVVGMASLLDNSEYAALELCCTTSPRRPSPVRLRARRTAMLREHSPICITYDVTTQDEPDEEDDGLDCDGHSGADDGVVEAERSEPFGSAERKRQKLGWAK